ncbi:hypothetical protein [Methylobacterium dankookense]|uniref:Uncharacterized protein n=1 Tax=Methylobacterium dankookense TaxID=560405 RepID=A0A564FUT9_9HYPH|nr:hypothetical protein [Methylobacterium dankookense]GJD54499.1 hypothetical protein IFDJLNFL_0371 [Methylobacterium dankookense]VUF11812.1 hypothetical protein MTDSW087_01497 [Methylobacterium dankookense]
MAAMRWMGFAAGFVALLGSPGMAAPRLVLDYRNPQVRTQWPSYAPAERAAVARALEGAPEAIRTDMGRSFAIIGDARGAYTTTGTRERIYLIQQKAPVAIDPFPNAPAPVLLVLAEGAAPRFYRLTTKAQFQRLVASADADRDGRDEVLLESTVMNMGQSISAVTVLRLDPATETAPEVQTLPEVVSESCDAGRGPRTRTVAAITVAEGGGFQAQRFPLPCG